MGQIVFVFGVEVNKFKANDSEINAAALCLGNVSEDFSTDNMKKTGLYKDKLKSFPHSRFKKVLKSFTLKVQKKFKKVPQSKGQKSFTLNAQKRSKKLRSQGSKTFHS